MHHKKLVLPVHCIKMAWDDISLPIYDRGFDWMVILYKLEYDCLRIQTVLPVLLHSVMTLSVMDFWLDERGAALRMCRDSKHIPGMLRQYTVFQMKQFKIH